MSDETIFKIMQITISIVLALLPLSVGHIMPIDIFAKIYLLSVSLIIGLTIYFLMGCIRD